MNAKIGLLVWERARTLKMIEQSAPMPIMGQDDDGRNLGGALRRE